MDDNTHVVSGMYPVADAFAGTVYSDIFKMSNYKWGQGIIHKGVGATGTATITVEACDDVSASSSEAIPFKYQLIISGDTHGAVLKATTAGFTTTAGSNQMYKIIVEADDLVDSGYAYARIKSVEVVNSPIVGAIGIILFQSRYNQEIQPTAIV